MRLPACPALYDEFVAQGDAEAAAALDLIAMSRIWRARRIDTGEALPEGVPTEPAVAWSQSEEDELLAIARGAVD